MKVLVHSVARPQWDAGVERMSEANRWVSLWRALTLMVRRMVCLSLRPVAISETAAEVACRWSKMKDCQKDGLPTGTPRMRML